MFDSKQQVTSLIAGLDAAVQEMLRDDLPQQRDAIIDALQAQDWLMARQLVHTVNGSASFCHLRELQVTASTLEMQLTLDGSPDENDVNSFLQSIETVLKILGTKTENHKEQKDGEV